MTTVTDTPTKKQKPTWVSVVKSYQTPQISASVWQILTSIVPYFLLLPVLYFSMQVSYLLTLALAVIISGFLVRTFIIQHDCGHGSFFKSKRWNAIVGNVCGFLTLTPYDYWRTSHAIHHAHNGDLDHRGTGDVYTMTLREYEKLSTIGKIGYRIYRNPFFMFCIGGPFQFIFLYRSPVALWTARSKQARLSIIRTDLVWAIALTIIHFTIGFQAFFMMYLPVIFITTAAGVWLFYVQHQFEEAYWSKAPDWEYSEAALKGSTYYRLPKVLQWFSGNIGLHHIHHLSPLIPNYQLQRCHDENPEFQEVPTISLADSIRIVVKNLAVWDEEQETMLNFPEANRRIKELAQTKKQTNTELAQQNS